MNHSARLPLPRKKASRHGRYRKNLLNPTSLAPIAQPIAAVFDKLDQHRQQGKLSDAEFVGYGLLTLLACRRPDAFQRHRCQQKVAAANPSEFSLADFWTLLCAHPLPIAHYREIFDQPLSLYAFLNQIRFRGIPNSAQQALLKWLEQQYPLTLVFHIPSTSEVFALQKQGKRCISFLKEAKDLTELHHERDAISFIIHDLVHAHEFYASPQRARQQIGFYHWLDNIQDNPALLALQAESPEFRQRWDYVLSDMNAYCGHLLKTLRAAFSLHDHSPQGQPLWNHVVEASDLSPDEKILFLKINSREWNDKDFLQLESIFEKKANPTDFVPMGTLVFDQLEKISGQCHKRFTIPSRPFNLIS